MCNKVKTVQGSWICPVIFIPWSHAGLTCNLMSVRLSDYHSSNNQKKHVAGILQCPYQFRHSLYDSIPTCTRGISISILRLLPIRFLLYLPIWAAASQSESCIIKGYLRTWCRRYFIFAKLRPDRNMTRSSYRSFKFKKIVKSNAPEFELLAANRTSIASVPHVTW